MTQVVCLSMYLLSLGSLAFGFIRSWYFWWRIKQHGISTTAKVLSTRQGRGNIVRSRYITYSFDAAIPGNGSDQTFTATRTVNRPAYLRAKNTSEIGIKFV